MFFLIWCQTIHIASIVWKSYINESHFLPKHEVLLREFINVKTLLTANVRFWYIWYKSSKKKILDARGLHYGSYRTFKPI